MNDINQKSVLDQINTVKSYVQTNPHNMEQYLYSAMDGIAKTVIAFRESNGQQGWASTIKNSDGEQLWTDDLAKQLEELTPSTIQIGGALTSGDIKLTTDSELVSKIGPPETPTIDEMVESVKGYLATIDAKNRELASLIGPIAYIKSLDKDPTVGPYMPYLPTPVKIPARAILPMINALLETLRLLASNSFYDVGFLRKILSIVMALFDVLRGEWRNGVLSFMGVFGQSYMIYGLIGKTFGYVYNFISPDIQTRLETDILAASKSALIGVWLWIISIVSPDFVRAQVNDLINRVRESAENLNEQLQKVEQQAQATAAPLGLVVKFPTLPLDKIPTFDDIQNLQAILRQPEIYCLPQVQQAILGATKTPALRIALELLSIPVRPLDMAKSCAERPSSFVETAVDTLKPTVYPVSGTQVGGRRHLRKKTRKHKKHKSQKKSRRI